MALGRCQLLSLLVLLVASSPRGNEQETRAGDYEVLWSRSSAAGYVQVVRMEVNGFLVNYLLCDDSVVGAQFAEEDLREHNLFPIFSLLASSRFLYPKPARAMVLGLGAGLVPSDLRRHAIHTDVVEISPAIVEAAVRYFGYEFTEGSSDHLSNPLAHVTTIANVIDFATGERAADVPKYDLIIHDLYSGSDLATTLTQQVFISLRDSWLEESGVLIVNFLGFISVGRVASEVVAFGAAVANTLRSVFAHVRCYREVPLKFQPESCNNMLCFCSDRHWELRLPTDLYAEEVPEMSPEWLTAHFQEWEVFGTLPNQPAASIITNTTAMDYRHAGDVIAAEMRQMAREQIMPHPGFWDKMISGSWSGSRESVKASREL